MDTTSPNDTVLAEKFLRLVAVITRLRAPDGCPWDQKQTPTTFRTYLLEEVYELVEAMDGDRPAEVCEELGDLLFQLIFVNNLFAEKGHFTLAEVIDTITAKMIRRHPHVFGDRKIDSEAALKRQWHSIKAAEKKQSRLMSVPRSLPALRRAQRLLDRAARTGFAGPAPAEIEAELSRSQAELRKQAAAGDRTGLAAVLGRLLFLLVMFGRQHDIACEDILAQACDRFVHLFNQLEDEAAPDLPDLAGEAGREFWNAFCGALGGCRDNGDQHPDPETEEAE